MTPCPEFVPLLELRLTDSLGEHAPRLEEHLAVCAACRSEVATSDELLGLARLPSLGVEERRSLEGLSHSIWKGLERARVRRLMTRGGLGFAAAAAAVALFVWPHAVPMAPVAPVAEVVASASASGEVLDLSFGSEDDDDTLDLEDFAALDTVSANGSMASSASDDDDDDTLLLGEEL